MSCIGCEEYATRITNIFRDEELKNKFEELVSVEVNNSKLLKKKSFCFKKDIIIL